MNNSLQYFFTKFGEVFAGWEFFESKSELEGYRIVIQGTKLRDYGNLKHEEKTIEKISEYGWVLGNDTIVGTIESDKFQPEIKQYQSDWWKGEFERKHLFIFGAGASSHCIYGNEKKIFDNDNLRPPLGKDLFDKRFTEYFTKYKGVKLSLNELQDENGSDVEALFEKEWKHIYRHNNQAVMKRHINIQYYLQELLSDISKSTIEKYNKNLYGLFADKIQKKHAQSIKNEYGRVSYNKYAFISFNQDTILDEMLSQYFSKPLQTMEDYVNYNDSPFCLFKPHGSWNWGWKFPTETLKKFKGNTAKWLFDNNINFFQLYFELLGNHVNMIDWSTWGLESMLNKHHLGRYTIDKSQLQIIGDNLYEYYPGLLLPYRDKDEFTMPVSHFFTMQHYIDSVETLVIIGWKGNEEAFNKSLLIHGSRIKKIIIVDPDEKAVLKNLAPLLTKIKVKPIIYKTFEEFVLEHMDEHIN